MASTAQGLVGGALPLVESYKQSFLPVDDCPPIIISGGQGSFLFDTEGKRYLDLGAGLGVNVLGYSSEIITEALRCQAATLIHPGSEFITEPAVRLAEALLSITGFENVFFSNSGAEANEAAVKIARNYHQAGGAARKTQIVAFNGGFHGRTMLNISLGGNPAHMRGFAPLIPDIVHADCSAHSFKAAVSNRTAAVIVETIQSRNGVREINGSTVDAINELKQKYGYLVVVDEVQTGSMRCGCMLDMRRCRLQADIVTLGKGLGGGLPIGATLTREDIGSRMRLGQHGSTFGGSPLVTSVALAVLRTICGAPVIAGICEASAGLRKHLLDIFGAGNVTGEGLLLGAGLPPSLRGASGVVARIALDHGLIVRTSGPDALRFTPPFNMSPEELVVGAETLADVIATASSKAS